MEWGGGGAVSSVIKQELSDQNSYTFEWGI